MDTLTRTDMDELLYDPEHAVCLDRDQLAVRAALSVEFGAAKMDLHVAEHRVALAASAVRLRAGMGPRSRPVYTRNAVAILAPRAEAGDRLAERALVRYRDAVAAYHDARRALDEVRARAGRAA